MNDRSIGTIVILRKGVMDYSGIARFYLQLGISRHLTDAIYRRNIL